MSDAVCSLFNSGSWDEINRNAFPTANYHNSENLIFQHLPINEKIINPYRTNRFEGIIRLRNRIVMEILTSVDIVKIVECGGNILEIYEGFF